MASALTLAGLLSLSTPVAASATSPLLSGYGAPGGGEQAIIGSTLLNGPSGGAGGGSSASEGSSGVSAHVERGSGALGSQPVAGGLSSVSGRGANRAGSRGAVRTGAAHGQQTSVSPNPYVYSNLRNSASIGSSLVFGVSEGNLFLLIGAIVGLGLIGLLTTRLAALQD